MHCSMSINARSLFVQGRAGLDFVTESLRKHCCDVEIRIITGKGPLTRTLDTQDRAEGTHLLSKYLIFSVFYSVTIILSIQ